MAKDDGKVIVTADIAGIGPISGVLTLTELEAGNKKPVHTAFGEVKQPVTTKPWPGRDVKETDSR